VILHGYFRSSSSYRCRIAFNLKGISAEFAPVHLVRDGGQQKSEAYRALNPQALVPSLEVDGHVLTQSPAILEWLEETRPEPPLLPADPLERAAVRAFCAAIACEIHPLQNLRVLKYLTRELKVDEDGKNAWYRHWVRDGLEAFERELAQLPTSRFCVGDTPTLVDCCLVPQIFNGKRFQVDFSGLSRTMAAFEACMALPAFQKAQPSACPDFEA